MKTIPIILLWCIISVTAKGGHGHGGGGGRSGRGGGSHGGGGHGGASHGKSSHATISRTYQPPNRITYTCHRCSTAKSYPVYSSMPPTYVYSYMESHNRYSALLTGLALYNLGRSWHHRHLHYSRRPDEKCSMQVIERSQSEETEFPCFMMSSFVNHTAMDGAVDNDTRLVDITSSQNNVEPFLRNKGPLLAVTSDQQCVLRHNSTTYEEDNAEESRIPCDLLIEYYNTARPSELPWYVWVVLLFGTPLGIAVIYVCCECYSLKMQKRLEEEMANHKCGDAKCPMVRN